MTKSFISVYLEEQSIIIILLNLIRFGIMVENERISFDFCVYKVAITFSLIKSEENLCLEIE